MIFADGSRYRGRFEKDRMTGKGLFFHASGERFLGEFKDDQRHGLGLFTDSQGQQTLQRWHLGQLIDNTS